MVTSTTILELCFGEDDVISFTLSLVRGYVFNLKPDINYEQD